MTMTMAMVDHNYTITITSIVHDGVVTQIYLLRMSGSYSNVNFLLSSQTCGLCQRTCCLHYNMKKNMALHVEVPKNCTPDPHICAHISGDKTLNSNQKHDNAITIVMVDTMPCS